MNRDNTLKVAETSRKHAENYINSGNFGRAFSHYLIALKLIPEWKDELKETFIIALCKWGTELENKGRYDDLFKCYEQAVDVFPDNENILNNLGAHLLRCNLTKEAAYYFRKCLTLVPHYLPAFWNLENALNMAVERWHFRMLNDEHRNDAFREAITKKVRAGFNHILDIGTGTGILRNEASDCNPQLRKNPKALQAMIQSYKQIWPLCLLHDLTYSLMALEAGAQEIYACDASNVMIDIATEVFKSHNASGKIVLLPKHSKDLKIGQDILSKRSLVVTEILDSGLLGEHVLQTLIHAWENLLLPPLRGNPALKNSGVVIPFGAVVYLAGIECEEISKKFYLKQRKLMNLSLNFAKNECDYDTEDLKRLDFKMLTDVERVLDIDFNDPKALKKILNGDHDQNLNIKCVRSGRLDCFAVWFDLRLDEDIVLNTGPDSKESNCWDQAVFPLAENFHVEESQEIRTLISFLNGKIAISNDLGIEKNLANLLKKETQKTFKPSEEVIRILNDENLIKVLTGTKNKIASKCRNPVKILDCFPFPVFGLEFLLDRRDTGDVLHCVVPSENDKDLVDFIAKEYHLENNVICSVETEIDDVFEKIPTFDIVLLNVVESTGELKRSVSSRLDYIRKLLKSNAILLPEEITIMGELIESPWLERMSKVVNDEVTCGYHIGKFINAYKVSHHIDFNLSCIDKKERSKPFKVIQDLHQCEKSNFDINVEIAESGPTTALIYWFSLKFLIDEDIDTLQCSSVNEAAILFEKQEFENSVKLHVYYDEGLFHVEFKNNQ